jgi:hypothetical protein
MPAHFKYYALHYLDLWISQDRECCDALAGSDKKEKLRTLADAAVSYSIARNLRTKYDEGRGLPRLGPILKIIGTVHRADFKGDKFLPSVMKVRDKISAQYGRRNILSATTKFLWLKVKSPIIIYDGRARRALEVRSGEFEEYCRKWRERFEDHEQQIRRACETLPKVHEYTKQPEIATSKYIAKIAARPWFRERVLDVYLWHLGGARSIRP